MARWAWQWRTLTLNLVMMIIIIMIVRAAHDHGLVLVRVSIFAGTGHPWLDIMFIDTVTATSQTELIGWHWSSKSSGPGATYWDAEMSPLFHSNFADWLSHSDRQSLWVRRNGTLSWSCQTQSPTRSDRLSKLVIMAIKVYLIRCVRITDQPNRY